MSDEIVMDGVRWRQVVEFPAYRISENWQVWSTKAGKILRPWTDKQGRLVIVLSRNGKRFCRFVSRLLLEAFVGPCPPGPPGMECCHYNGNPSDNRLENLRWDTSKANKADSIRHGTTVRGSKISHSKLTETKVIEIRSLAGTMSQATIARKFGVSQVNINDIIHRKIWRHVK